MVIVSVLVIETENAVLVLMYVLDVERCGNRAFVSSTLRNGYNLLPTTSYNRVSRIRQRINPVL